MNSFRNPLQVRLYESHEEGFTAAGQHLQMCLGDVEFSYCIEDVLAMLAEPDCKTRIVTFDNDIVRIGREKVRHLSGMRTTRVSNAGHKWYTMEFKPMMGMNNAASFRLFLLQICALVALTPQLVQDEAVRYNIDQMVAQHSSRTLA